MGDFVFLRPWWLIASVPIVLLWWRLRRDTDVMQRWLQQMDAHLLEALLVGEHRGRGISPISVLLLIWLGVVCSLSGPSWRLEPSPFAADQAALMILLKVDESMLASDVQPSRLDRAKQKIEDLVEHRQGAATGLIVYSGSAHLVMPPTRDSRIITRMLQGVGPDTMPVPGDRVDAALSLAAESLSRMPGSVVVIADSATIDARVEEKLSGQVLAMSAIGGAIHPGLVQLGKTLGGDVRALTIDDGDVSAIAKRSKKAIGSAGGSNGQRRSDGGYWLLPFIACGSLLWFRRGWTI